MICFLCSIIVYPNQQLLNYTECWDISKDTLNGKNEFNFHNLMNTLNEGSRHFWLGGGDFMMSIIERLTAAI